MVAAAVPVVRGSIGGGTRVLLRRIEPEDKRALRDGLRHYSAQTLYRRFFAPVTELSPEQLKFLTEVDQVDHVAWIAFDEALPVEGATGIGVARWVRLSDQPAMAEMALIAQDAYQGRGLGSLLLAVLSETARTGGIRTLRALVLGENDRFIATLVSYGATARHESLGQMRVDLPVYDDLAAVPHARFAATLAAVRAQLSG